MARKALANATSIDFNIIIELHEGGTTTSISNMICTLAGSRSSKVAELLHVILVAFQILANDQIFNPLADHSRVGLEQRVLQMAFMCARQQTGCTTDPDVYRHVTYQLVDDL